MPNAGWQPVAVPVSGYHQLHKATVASRQAMFKERPLRLGRALRCASPSLRLPPSWRLRLGPILRCEGDRCMHRADVDLAGRLGNKPPSCQIRCVYAGRLASEEHAPPAQPTGETGMRLGMLCASVGDPASETCTASSRRRLRSGSYPALLRLKELEIKERRSRRGMLCATTLLLNRLIRQVTANGVLPCAALHKNFA